MRNKKSSTSLQTTLAASTLVLLPFSVQAVEISMSGQVSRLIMNVDNGPESGVVHADNSVSDTRWRLMGEDQLDNGMHAGLLYEIQLQSNPTREITADTLDSDGVGGNVGDGDYFLTRQGNIWLRGDFGKVTIGQGSGAADGSAEVDESGTTVIQYSGASVDLLGSMEYGDSGVSVDQARSHFDGLDRNDNIRYDMALEGFQLAASLGNGGKFEASARFAVADVKIMFGFWDENDSGGGDAGHAVSASWADTGGLSLTGAYGTEDSDGDPDNLYLKLGYREGEHAFAVDWSETSDLGPGDADSISIAWVGTMIQGVEFYATYRIEDLDGVNDADKIRALAGGARIKF